MKFWIIALVSMIILGLVWYYRSHPLMAKVVIRGQYIGVEVAATDAQKQRGLGGRPSMPASAGMLFPYDHKEDYNFWMRDMQFPLDFIWIDGETVVDITENVLPPRPGEKPAIVKPRVLVDKVLEVNAGTVKRLGIVIGDKAEFLDR
jgi:uncharacterized membrane protein (UPF0127 family)